MNVTRPIEYIKVWGKELEIVNNNLYCGKELRLKKRFRCSIHLHKVKDETFYVLRGLIYLELMHEETYQKKQFILRPGDIIRLYPGIYHRFTGLKNSAFIEFSTTHRDSDSYRLSTSEKIRDDEFNELKNSLSIYINK